MNLEFLSHGWDLLEAFIKAESEQYHWRNGIDGPEAVAFREKSLNTIREYTLEKEINYVVVYSFSNMGSVSSSLTLTPVENWGPENQLIIAFGTTPRDKLNFYYSPSMEFGIWDISSTDGAKP